MRRSRLRSESGFDDRILGEEARGIGKTGQRQGADQHHQPGGADMGGKAAHLADILFVRHRVDDRARAQEHERLEEGVGEQMEHARPIGANTHGDEHVAQLRTGRIGDDALDVVLDEADGRGEEGGDATYDDHHFTRCGRQFVERRHAGDEEDPRRHHGRGMDQGRDRGRAFHGVGQPGVQDELRRLAHGAHEQQEADEGQDVDVPAQELHRLADLSGSRAEDRVQFDRAENEEDGGDAEHEAEIADPVDDEGLDRGGIGRRPQIPEADQEIGGETDPFPAEKHLQEIVGRHQHQHEEGEQRQIGEEARLMRIVAHIADRIDMDERGDGIDHYQHHHRQRIDAQGPIGVEGA